MNASVELRQLLDRVGDRFRQLRLWGGLAACWLVFAAVGVAANRSVFDAPSGLRTLAALLAVGAALAGLGWWLATRRVARDPRWIARRIEAKHPDLSALLLTAVEQEKSAASLGFLQSSLLESAVAHGRSHDWLATVPQRGLRATQFLHAASFAALIAVLAILGLRSPAAAGALAATFAGSSIPVTVEPGNAEVERGNPLLVIAHFGGTVPAEANLVVEGANPRPMFRSLEDPKFAGHLPTVENDLSYRVEFPGGASETYRVKVYEHPDLRRVNAHLVFPAYTNQPPKTAEDVRHVTVPEGTEVTLFCQLNKPVTVAKLLDEQKQELALTPHDAGLNVYKVTLTPKATQRYKLHLTDADGRANKLPADISVRVTPNQPPVVKVIRPGHDTRVSPLEELPLKADLKDDYGLARYGLSVTAPDQTSREIVLHEVSGPANLKKSQPDHLLDLEAMKAQPDQVVSYYFWAEDIGPDGKRRRTSGDLFFAEVRHFEEIFRQGEQQTREQQERERQEREQGQQGGNAQQADQLAELQKQIVNATWTLIRRETGAEPSAKFAENVKTIRESQQTVLQQAEALGEKLEAAASIEFLAQAMKLMTQAEKQLADAKSPAALPAALASEQAAYQALLKLRAREFDVTRNNSRQRSNSQSASNSRSPSQQQLRQLDLAEEQNRYETQSTARAQQERQAQRDREQRENNELADKLKELARRQNDLTDRVKELQSALEQAKEAKQKEELQQQLKRLRDQQQQVLRDTDDLKEQLERPENQEKRAEAKSQLEQSRENIRQASDALEKGQLSQAVNEGTRAGRQLDTLKEQLRKEAAGQFGEEMKELRQQARQLDEDQQKLTKQLDEMKQQNQKPGLRDSGEKEQVQKGLEQQQKRFTELNERMQKTVQEAEKPEPLLAQQLFNTARGAAEQKVGESLNLARQLAEAGGTADAAEAARKAGQGTEQLRKGVEKAAEKVLGGSTEAMKRAQRELDDLAEQFNLEVAQATGQPQRGKGEPNPMGNAGQNPPSQQSGQGQPMGGQQPGQGQPMGGPQPNPMSGQQGRPMGGQPGSPMGGQQGNPMGGQGGQQENPMGGQRGQQGQPAGGQQRGQGQQGRRSLTDPPMPGQQGGGNQQPSGTAQGREGPIREGGFREWTDRLRAAEDLIEDPQLRAEAAQIRDRVRTAREEFKRHAKEPDWKKLQDLVTKPMNELRTKLAQEIRRRESPDALVPIDRDPVPPQFADGVRRYYERLGSDK
ncbi:coiled-coil domain-containing protein [Limnoglobus roseus]|uniref:Large adhesin n=1 Tax=Limnoglobus roseus TaxID=2598579 RepID=A0A5C1ANF8_9BACT|nr:DUF4175 family protein [Limnoglobus roseus]QEL19653.1 large adhesin [Limnoglobus roseus]